MTTRRPTPPHRLATTLTTLVLPLAVVLVTVVVALAWTPRLPEPVALKVASWRWRLRLAPVPPGVLPYARHPWVVANDRLTALGWSATSSNEEAYVVGHDASLLESISPQRRQELALGITGAVGAAVVAGTVALVRRKRRSAG